MAGSEKTLVSEYFTIQYRYCHSIYICRHSPVYTGAGSAKAGMTVLFSMLYALVLRHNLESKNDRYFS